MAKYGYEIQTYDGNFFMSEPFMDLYYSVGIRKITPSPLQGQTVHYSIGTEK